jgi:hypothetical protein
MSGLLPITDVMVQRAIGGKTREPTHHCQKPERLVPIGAARHKADMGASDSEQSRGGYSVAYSRDDTQFPVYVTAAVAAIFFTAA